MKAADPLEDVVMRLLNFATRAIAPRMPEREHVALAAALATVESKLAELLADVHAILVERSAAGDARARGVLSRLEALQKRTEAFKP